MGIGLSRSRRPAVSLDEAGGPGVPSCPACGKPLFVWIETEGWGPREDQVIDRCENCGLVVPRDAVPSPDRAADELLAAGAPRNGAAAGSRIRVPNAASLQAWLGAENWAGLRPGERSMKMTPRAAALLLDSRGLRLGRVRHLAGPGMAAMWQTLLNLLTFHRDFAAEAASGRLRPGTGRGRAAFAIDSLVTVLAAIPTALLAVVLEGAATLVRRGGVIEIEALPRA
jgi:hypothetical protein